MNRQLPGKSSRKRLHWAVGLISVIVMPSIVLTDELIAVARGYRPAGRPEILLVGLSLAVIVIAPTLLMFRRGRSLLERFHKQLALLFGTLFCLVILTEIALTLYLPPGGQYHLRPPNMKRTREVSPEIMPGVSGESRFTTNSLGIRGPEMPERDAADRILCVGGSTTECYILDDSESWPSLVMENLNDQGGESAPVWVGNTGISGYFTRHHLHFAKTSSLMGEIDVLLVMPGINDLWKFLARPNPHLDPTLPPKPAWYHSSIQRYYWLLRARSTRGGIQVETEDSQVRRQRIRQRATKVDALPDLRDGLSIYKQRLRDIISECRARGVAPVFTSQPVVWSTGLDQEAEDLLWFGWLPSGDFLTAGALRKAMDEYNDALRDVCEEAEAGFIDLTAVSGKLEYFVDDCHFNEAGAREVARIVSRWFQTNGLPSQRSVH